MPVAGVLAILLAGLALWTSGKDAVLSLLLAALCLGYLASASMQDPFWIVVFALAISSLTGGPRLPDVAGMPFRMRGILTGILLAVSAFALVYRRRSLHPSWFIDWLPLLLFAGWAWLRIVGSPSVADGLSDAILFSAPISIGLVTRVVIQERPRHQVDRAVVLSASLSIAFVYWGFAAGFITQTDLGFSSPLGVRTLALFLLVALALSIPWVLESRGTRRNAALVLFSVTALVLLYFSRSTMACLIVFGWILPVGLWRPRRIRHWSGALLTGLVLAAGVLLSPAYSSRSFAPAPSESPSPSEFVSSGRFEVWPGLMLRALEHPWFGEGTGAARMRVESLFGWGNPHNDYLRVLYDLGAVGLILLLSAWATEIVSPLRLWRAHPPSDRTQYHAIAAFLASTGCVIPFLTDNTLVYAFVMMPVFILMAVARGQDVCQGRNSLQAIASSGISEHPETPAIHAAGGP